MALLEPHRSGKGKSYDCPSYTPRPRSKHCQHYQDGGACALAPEFQCVEWLRANGRPLRDGHPALSSAPTQTDLFGTPVSMPRNEARVPAPAPEPAIPASPSPPPLSRPGIREPITKEEIDSFKALGVAVSFRTEHLGEVWLVPEYTEHDRQEITPEHAATLRLLLDAFPEAQITAFEKLTRPKAEPT